MGEQQKSDAWSLGYDWAMGNVYIGDECRDPIVTSLQLIPEFEEGVQAALNQLKKEQLQELVLGGPDDEPTDI